MICVLWGFAVKVGGVWAFYGWGVWDLGFMKFGVSGLAVKVL